MSLKVSELLNPVQSPSPPRGGEEDSPQAQRTPDSSVPSSSRNGSVSNFLPATASVTMYEAADALTALATSGAPPAKTSYALGQNLPYPSNFGHYSPPQQYTDTRRASTFGPGATPVEPPLEHANSLDRIQPCSPTLDQYHHGSKSPEEQKRLSLSLMRSSPAPRLAPIQSLSVALNDQIGEGEDARRTHGHDVSRMVSSAGEEAPVAGTPGANDIAQDAERACALDSPTRRTREPSPARISPHSHPQPDPQAGRAPNMSQPGLKEALPSPPLPQIKREPAATPREHTPAMTEPELERRNSAASGMDPETLKAVAELKNEHGLRANSRETSHPAADAAKSASASAPAPSPTPTPTPTPAPAPAPAPASKKRAAPKSSAPTKKGTASKKPPPKKRKTEAAEKESLPATPTAPARRSATPSTKPAKPPAKAVNPVVSKKSQSGTPLAGSSPAPPSRTSPAPPSDREPEEAGSDPEEGAEVFCICRRPDNHTWMIACDGGCEDWYHGKCVDIKESDGELIDKYICPHCEKAGRGHTTWKPVCRRDGCRKPARVKRQKSSKYCSDQCGKEFMQAMVQRSAAASAGRLNGASGLPGAATDRRRANYTDNTANADDSASEMSVDLGPRGGPLNPPELKALVSASKTIDRFRSLGDGVLSPPAAVSPTRTRFSVDETAASDEVLSLDEAARIADIAAEKNAMRVRLTLLKEREKSVQLAKERAIEFGKRESIKQKDLCGFDRRLAWSEQEFDVWRASEKGQRCLKEGNLDLEFEDGQADGVADGASAGSPGQQNGASAAVPDGEPMQVDPPPGAILCRGTGKRCTTHPNWHKIALQDVRFEEVSLSGEFKKLEAEEKEIRNRAMVRARVEKAEESAGKEGAVREGWVEVVEE